MRRNDNGGGIEAAFVKEGSYGDSLSTVSANNFNPYNFVTGERSRGTLCAIRGKLTATTVFRCILVLERPAGI